MNKETAQQRILELSAEIEKHNYNYYVLSHPTISDYDFDMLLEELIRLEKQYLSVLAEQSQKNLKRLNTNILCCHWQTVTAKRKLWILINA